MIDKSKYVMLDVETNGTSSLRDDLLSISLYRPDIEDAYTRFLPLELQSNVLTTDINGIKKKDLIGAKPLSQNEVDELFERFELHRRTILTYGSLDERFIRTYFKRKKLAGFSKMHFYNFKRDFITDRFSDGFFSKDNLCLMFGIDGVTGVHSGENDCLLQWKLYEKLDGRKLFFDRYAIYEFNDEYIVPASYLIRYPNFKHHMKNFPSIKIKSKVVKEFVVEEIEVEKHGSNIDGLLIEHVINRMIGAEEANNELFYIKNKSRLKLLQRLASFEREIGVVANDNGTFMAVNPEDEGFINRINDLPRKIKENFGFMVEYLKTEIFKGEPVISQELVIDHERNVQATCDLSNHHAVVEIKTNAAYDVQKYKDQIYFQAHGRDLYVLQAVWGRTKAKLYFKLIKVNFVEPDAVRQ